MSATQRNRPIQVATPLGEDVLLFYRMNGSESLSELFEYELELLSANAAIQPEKLLGENITVGMVLPDGSRRYFNGYVTRFGQYGTLDIFSYYRATVRPWLWFLTRSANCRIFQQKTTPDIIKQVFKDQGFSDIEEKLTGQYSPREYCVQYRETDFNFVSRLMEEEGIYYYFTHENGKHHLVLADSGSAHEPFPGYATIPYHPEEGGTDRSRTDHIYHWGFAREVQTGGYSLTDYDFKKPKSDLLVKAAIQKSHAHSAYEFFDYPGQYTETGAGDQIVRHRIEEHHVRFERCEGSGNARGLAPGHLFTLSEFPRQDQNRQYLVQAAAYRMQMDDYLSTSHGSGADRNFECGFTALDHAQPFRPARVTPKPLVHGAQTAMVVGPKGEEIHTDQYGRVKVQFHWDRYGKRDQNSSCWVRVSQPWAGKNWGTIAIPRIGQEVIVDFLEGDPDQPIITGRVYNADQKPPYGLPAAAHVMGFKSSSTPGGNGYCEMVIHDSKGQEKIVIHSQKDMDTTVRNNDTQHVMVNRTIVVDGKHDETVKKDMTTVVAEGNQANIVKAGSIYIEAATTIVLKVGSSTIEMNKDGGVFINGVYVKVVGSGKIDLNP